MEYGDVLLGAVLVVLLLGVAFSGSTGSWEPVALQWAVRSVAVLGVAAMVLLRGLLAASLAPRQMMGVAVDAMVVGEPDERLVLFAERPVETVCHMAAVHPMAWMAQIEQRARVMVRAIWVRVWRRSKVLPVMSVLSGRVCFLPPCFPEPLS